MESRRNLGPATLASWWSDCLRFGSTSTRPVALPLESRPVSPLGPEPGSTPTLAPTPTDLAPDGTRDRCIFCGVTSTSPGFNVVHEDDEFVVFRDRSPGSKVHLLAVPKRHIDNVKTLTVTDADMLIRMKAVGHATLAKVGVSEGQQRLGFHIPPFFSVNHLHLHLLSLPLPFPGSFKYRPSVPTSFRQSDSSGCAPLRLPTSTKLKGFSWFVEIDQVIQILHAGQRVKVGSVRTQAS